MWICCLSVCCVLVAVAIFLAIATTRGYGQYPPEIKDAAFSNDNNSARVAGIEVQWNKGIYPIPLQGWTGPVRPRSRIFIQDTFDDIESRVYFEDVYNRELQSAYFMETEGYILLPGQPHQSFTIVHIEDGSTRVGPNNITFAVPSPDGSVIAALNELTGGWRDRNYEITFLDSETLEAIVKFDPFVVELPRAHRYINYWEDNESFSFATIGYDIPNFEWDNDDHDDDVRTNTIAPAVTWTVDGKMLTHVWPTAFRFLPGSQDTAMMAGICTSIGQPTNSRCSFQAWPIIHQQTIRRGTGTFAELIVAKSNIISALLNSSNLVRQLLLLPPCSMNSCTRGCVGL